MAGTSSAKTRFALLPGHDDHKKRSSPGAGSFSSFQRFGLRMGNAALREAFLMGLVWAFSFR
jgi:hypothetical protein